MMKVRNQPKLRRVLRCYYDILKEKCLTYLPTYLPMFNTHVIGIGQTNMLLRMSLRSEIRVVMSVFTSSCLLEGSCLF